MAGYTKEYLVDAFLHSYAPVLLTMSTEKLESYVAMVNNFYDEVGRDKFRTWCSLDADALRKFKLESKY